MLWNWNILGPGQHTVRVLADGIEPSDLTQELLLAAVQGDWSGTWYSTTGTGSVSMTFVESSFGTPGLENFRLTGTGCAEGGFSNGFPFNVNEPIFEIIMDDSSLLALELSATESVSMLGGDFYFDSGPCAEAEGMYYMFRN